LNLPRPEPTRKPHDQRLLSRRDFGRLSP
jgi:hypothetical protein